MGSLGNLFYSNACKSLIRWKGDEDTGITRVAETLDQHEKIEEPPLTSMLFKDALLLLAALSIWAAAYSWFQFSDLLLAKVLMAADALIVGFIVASLFHEWGHYAGARGSGGNTTRFAGKPLSIFRFNFDFEQNTKSQFLWMSYGGQIGHLSLIHISEPTRPY